MRFKELRIKAYRGIRELELPLNKINVIVGPNNIGKSAILEAFTLIALKDNNFIDAKGDNVVNYLVKIKRYPLESIINLDAESAQVETDDLSLRIEYFREGLPPDEAYPIIEYFENKITHFIKNDTSWITIRALELFARKIKFENQEAFREVSSSVLKQLGLLDEKELREFSERMRALIIDNPKLIFVSDNTLHLYLPRPSTIEFGSRLNPFEVLSLFNRVISIKSGETRKLENVIFSFQRTGTEAIYKLYEELVKKGTINSAISIIRDFIPYVIDIRMVESKEIFILTTFLNDAISINSMGDGFISLVRMIFLFGLVKNGLIILEEPEISLHPGFINIISNVMVSNFHDNQILISTHSIDFVENLLETAKQKESLDTINIIRLHRREDVPDIFAEILDGKEALEEIEAIGIDLRST